MLPKSKKLILPCFAARSLEFVLLLVDNSFLKKGFYCLTNYVFTLLILFPLMHILLPALLEEHRNELKPTYKVDAEWCAFRLGSVGSKRTQPNPSCLFGIYTFVCTSLTAFESVSNVS